jgi:hypothetical protein
MFAKCSHRASRPRPAGSRRLGLQGAALGRVYSAGPDTGDLARMTHEELLAVPGIGRRILDEIRAALTGA